MRSSFILLFATAIAVRLPLPKSPRARILKAELTEAWLEESKAGLVQMLRENHPWVEQSRAVFTMLAANAPPPTEGEWVSGDYVVRSSAIIADALESAGGDESKLLDGAPVSLSVSESGELALELSLDCGVDIRATGTIERRTIPNSWGILTVTIDDVDMQMSVRGSSRSALAEALNTCETILRPSLPDGDAPFVATLRPLFVDNDLMLLREMSRPKGREVLMLVLSRATAARGEATALAATKQQQQQQTVISPPTPQKPPRVNRDEWIPTEEEEERRAEEEGRKTAEREAATERLKQSTRDTLNIWSLGPRAQALSSWPDASEKLQPVVTEGVKWLLNGTLLLGPYPFARSFKGARPSYELLSRLISIGVCGPTTIMRFSTAMHHSL